MKKLNKKEIKKFVQKTSKREKEIYVVLENIEYARNVAAIFRTADAAGVKKLILTGISKTPPFGKEMRQVSRNTEGAVAWEFEQTSGKALQKLKKQGFYTIAVELTDNAVDISDMAEILKEKQKVCFVLGSEVFGVTKAALEHCDKSAFIPMYGKGASLNVSAAAAIVLFSF